MCIAILNSKKALPKEYLSNSWDNNNQGAGMLYNLNGKLTAYKTYDKKEFINQYYKIRAQIKGKIVLHFRIATSGFEKYTNLHPFLVNDKLGFVHNGIISGLGNKQHSDTYQFNQLLQGFKHDFINCKNTLHFIADYIGSSKLVFLDSNDNHTIVNEKSGHWNGNDWYSNDSYLTNYDFYYYGNEKVSKNSLNCDFDYDKAYKATTDSYLEEYLSFYQNATEENISLIEYVTGIDRNASEFIDLIEDVSFVINSIDLKKILEKIEEEAYSNYTEI
jgi:predicted glutamine amidotransferase